MSISQIKTRPETAVKTKPTESDAYARTPMLYRISSVMTLLEVSHATVYRMVGRGELELVRLSARSSRITSESVAKVVAGRGKEFRQE
jgi:predicted DNA-binding transcriptional regulator AlpA